MEKIITYDPNSNQTFLSGEDVLKKAQEEINKIVDKKKEKGEKIYVNDPEIMEVFYNVLGMPRKPGKLNRNDWQKVFNFEES